MFRSLYEGYEDPRQNLTNYFQYSGPDQVLTTNAGMQLLADSNVVQNLRSATNIAAMGQRGEPILSNIEIRFQPAEISPELAAMQEQCKLANIDNVIATAGTRSTYRCGWLYEKGTGIEPRINKGWLGSANGPLGLFGPTEGKWYWDVAAAKKQILTDRCSQLTSCSQLGAPEFAGICGFCTTSGRGIPIDGNGQPLYNDVPATRCVPSKVVRQLNQCPPPPPPTPPAPLPPGVPPPRVYQVCDPLPGNRLRQDCLLQQAKLAGCTDDGSLITALATNANPSDYAASLRQANAFKVYQDRSPYKFNDDFLRQGKATLNTALAAFKVLHSQANSETANALTLAAQDLCTRRGALEQFDFCTEVADSTPPPFALDCLQKEFRKAGGQAAGSKYPTAATMTTYQAMPNFGTFKEFVRDLAARAKSADVAVQEKALVEFLGVRRQTLDRERMPKLNAFEAFYFTRSGFIGRRIRQPEVGATTVVPADGEAVILFDVRPPREMSVRLRGSRNLIVSFNGGRVSTDCITLKKEGNNKIQLFGKTDIYAAFYGECSSAQPNTTIPKDWLAMTQDYYAPVLSFGVFGGNFKERRLPRIFETIGNGYNTEIRESNTQNAPAGRSYITFTGSSSNMRLAMPLLPQAFISFCLIFRLTRPISTGTERIMTMGTFFTEIVATTGGPTGTLIKVGSSQAPIEVGRWLVLVGEQDRGRKTFKLSIGPATSPDVRTDLTVSGGGEQLLPAAGFNFLFGKVGDAQYGSAGMDVASFNLYDYSLTSKEIKTDIDDAWPSLPFDN